MRGTRKLLVLALPLLMAACGQSTTPTANVSTPDTEAPAMTGGKTLGESLQEPGWVQTSEGFWERDTANGHESIYMGANGAKQALIQRQAIQAKMLETASASDRVEMQARFDAQNASLVRASNAKPNLSAQSIDQCTYNQSIQALTAQPGIKATGWINCPQSGYYPTVGGEAHSNYGDNQIFPTKTATSASGQTSMAGTSNCSAYVYTQASDFWGYTVGKEVRGYGCYGVTTY